MKINVEINTQQISENVMRQAEDLIQTRVRYQVSELFRQKGTWGHAEGFASEMIRKAVDDYASSDVLAEKIQASIVRQIDEAADESVRMALRHVAKRMVFSGIYPDGKSEL